jgi:lipopolysaccharide biosynthesis protein
MVPLFPQKDTRLLAFYLPQYHPIPENDAWWGKGFTEWTKVTQGRPLFKGHQQPHLPADLGFYDLRLPEVRAQQAELARDAGLNGFIYYHYWFNGRRLLERPTDEVLRLKQPDFPFCLCWANEPWSRNWDGENRSVLMPQAYSDAGDLEHIQWLLGAFADERYLKIDGRPLFLIYRPSDLPDIRKTAAVWRAAAQRIGFPDLYLCAVRAFPGEFCDPAKFGLDALVDFRPNGADCGPRLKSDNPLEIGYRLHRVWDYDSLARVSLSEPLPDYRFFPSVCPCWDNSVRRSEGGVIFRGSTPDVYGEWLRTVLVREAIRPQKESLIAINAWNEWAEGNHLEPCQRWGHGYLDATREAISHARAYRTNLAGLCSGRTVAASPEYRLLGHVDGKSIESGTLIANGWCVEADSKSPPDYLAFAARQPDGRFVLLSPVEHQRLGRADVMRELGTQQSLNSGWAGRLALADAHAKPEDIHVLAIRARDELVASLACLG